MTPFPAHDCTCQNRLGRCFFASLKTSRFGTDAVKTRRYENRVVLERFGDDGVRKMPNQNVQI